MKILCPVCKSPLIENKIFNLVCPNFITIDSFNLRHIYLNLESSGDIYDYICYYKNVSLDSKNSSTVIYDCLKEEYYTGNSNCKIVTLNYFCPIQDAVSTIDKILKLKAFF